ncbi:hypothetical protein [Krasilnikovia sp. MM14-A1004]|uniref:hypothetical protein n=1 Tax=Krasilnikovia sp. MM14-A1004 TaxID=3373541 RepID=UPI00399C6D64
MSSPSPTGAFQDRLSTEIRTRLRGRLAQQAQQAASSSSTSQLATAVVQQVAESKQESKDDESIGERRRRLNEASRTHSARRREQLLGGDQDSGVQGRGRVDARRSLYVEPRERGRWDGEMRFAYYEETWTAVLAMCSKDASGLFPVPGVRGIPAEVRQQQS